jgi:hypothetical protein
MQASNGASVIAKLIATEHFLYHILQQYDGKTKNCTSFRGPLQSTRDIKLSGVGVPASTRSCAYHAVTDGKLLMITMLVHLLLFLVSFVEI